MSYRRLKKDGKYLRDAQGRYRYQLRFRVGGRDGRQRFLVRWFHSDREAEQYIAEQQGKSARQLTWREGLVLWLKHHSHLSERYLCDVELNLERLTRHLGDWPIEETSLRQFVGFMHHLAEMRSNITGNRARRELCGIARWLRKHGFVVDIPFEYVPTLRENRKSHEPFSIAELPRYLECLTQHSLPPVLFMALTGARSSATCNIKEQDIVGGVVHLHEKGGVHRRITVDDAIRQVFEMARQQKKEAGSESVYLFVHHRRTKWNADSIRRHCQKAWEAAGLAPHRIHDLRHMFGTEAARLSFGPDMIQAAMGHKDRRSAESYIHADDEMADRVGGAVREKLLPFLPLKAPEARDEEQQVTCPQCGHRFRPPA